MLYAFKSKVLVCLALFLFFTVTTPGFAAESDDDPDSNIVITYEDEEDEPEVTGEIKITYEDEDEDDSESDYTVQSAPSLSNDFTIEGLIEYESFINTDPDQQSSKAEKKGEVRGSLKLKQGNDRFHLFCRSDVYLYAPFNADENYHYSRDSKIFRNFKYASDNAEISFNELYMNFGTEKFRIRMGNQVFGWGTGDAFNPTSYFNPTDMREMFFKDDDELKQGVPAVSGMFFGNNFTLETVFVPLHVPGRIATGSDYWSLNLDNYTIPIIVNEPEKLDATPSNFSAGTRLTKTIGPGDFSLSVFHGPDKDPAYQATETLLADNNAVSVSVNPVYGKLTMVGMDCSINYDKFVFQIEAAYSPNKTGVEKQNNASVSDVQFPYTLKKTNFLSVTAGFNYFIPLDNLIEDHEGETVFIFEFFHADFLDDDVASPLLSEIALIRLQDSFFKSHLNISVTGIFDLKNNGRLIWPKIEYDFLNGFSTELAFADLKGEASSDNQTESIFYYLRKNDFITLKVRYEF